MIKNPGVLKLQSSAIISGTNWTPAHVKSYFILYYKISSITILSSDITNARAHVSYIFTSLYHLHDHNWLTGWAGAISEAWQGASLSLPSNPEESTLGLKILSSSRQEGAAWGTGCRRRDPPAAGIGIVQAIPGRQSVLLRAIVAQLILFGTWEFYGSFCGATTNPELPMRVCTESTELMVSGVSARG